jgi:hypothetical protein
VTAIIVIAVTATGCLGAPSSKDAMMGQVARLRPVLADLAEKRLTNYISTEWCEMYDEEGAAFASRPDLGTCALDTGATSFTAEARQEYDRLQAIFRSTGLTIEQVTLGYADGEVASAEFVLSGPLQHWSYVYDFHGTGVVDPPSERATVLSDQWTFWVDTPD